MLVGIVELFEIVGNVALVALFAYGVPVVGAVGASANASMRTELMDRLAGDYQPNSLAFFAAGLMDENGLEEYAGALGEDHDAAGPSGGSGTLQAGCA